MIRRARCVLLLGVVFATEACFRWSWNSVTPEGRDATADTGALDIPPADAADDLVTMQFDAADDVTTTDASDALADIPTTDACTGNEWRVNGTCVPRRSCGSSTTGECALVDVPAGTNVTLGNGTYPQPNISVSAFTLDAAEVSVRRFRMFWENRAMYAPLVNTLDYPDGHPVAFDTVGGAFIAPSTSDARCNLGSSNSASDNHPMNCVTWDVAMAFCAWDGGRLPTEAEFEYAARWAVITGLPAPERHYLWMPMTAPTGCHEADYAGGLPLDGSSTPTPCPGDDGLFTVQVLHYAQGVFYNLAGNVAEWTADVHDNFNSNEAGSGCWIGAPQRDPKCDVGESSIGSSYREIRGASMYTDNLHMETADSRDFSSPIPSTSVPASTRLPWAIGFRCARSR